jgi:monoamine oxidase
VLGGIASVATASSALAQRRRDRAPVSSGPSEVDVLIVGAGAAGIAAARRLSGSGRSFTMVEATGRIGGRCVTDTRSFGVPFDRGAHWIYTPDLNPLTKLAGRTGLDIHPAPTGQRIRIGQRYAREAELEDFLTAVVRSHRGISDAARGRTDIDCRTALPRDLGDWRSSVEFALGPYGAAADLNEISAQDMSRASERDTGAFCRQGYGALLAKLGEGIPVELNSPVTQVEFGRSAGVTATTPKGKLNAKYMIVTASTGVIASERIKFEGGLPKRQADALERLKLGSLDYIVLELTGNPLGLQRDDLVFEKSSGPRTAALLGNVSGTSLSMVTVGGRFGRELIAKGEKDAVEFAVEWLTGMFGPNVKKALGRTHVTQWNADQWTLGAIAAASPGGGAARRIMMEALRGRVYFAGEALHDSLGGTVAGAWESGERAATAVMRRISGLPDVEPPKPEPTEAERRREERRKELERRRQERERAGTR